MRVDLTTSGAGQTDHASTPRTGRGAATAQTSGQAEDPGSTDWAQFSFDQLRIRSLTAQALSSPEVRQAKVSSLAEAIGRGQYTVDAGKVADAIVSTYSDGTL